MEYLLIIFRTSFFIFTFYFIFLKIVNSIRKKINYNFFKNNVINNQIYQDVSFKDAKDRYADITEKELEEFNTQDLKAFKNYFYNLFIDFETAYNNLDFNMLKTLSTKQLFQNYYTGITLDLEAGNKRIISNIRKDEMTIFETFTSTAKQVVSAMIKISYINYTINKDGRIIRGSRDTRITEKFEVIFRKDFEKDDVKKCQNCGAIVTGNKCEYCRTIIKNVDFKISSIKKIIEK